MCRFHGCSRPATCLPRLYVPASKLSRNFAAEDVTALMGMPLCDLHFPQVTAKMLLSDARGGLQIRDQIADEFRKRNAYPSFDRAVIGRISESEADFKRFLIMQERARAN